MPNGHEPLGDPTMYEGKKPQRLDENYTIWKTDKTDKTDMK